ncbi:NACHT, LRR and PYD domains-containing protein 14 [Mortierella antarctica]|nr:NACHT, LRR and PYD domains-containing protein 14 [Mortierella antarctica]
MDATPEHETYLTGEDAQGEEYQEEAILGDDDTQVHTHLQLQGYLQDLEEAEAIAQEEADIAFAAEASHFSSTAHDIEAHVTIPNPLEDTAIPPLPGLLNHLLTPISVEDGVQRLGSLQQALDLEDMDDDDDEECLRPSETKYLLYDDHVSPVTIEEALMMLNENEEEMVLEEMQDWRIDTYSGKVAATSTRGFQESRLLTRIDTDEQRTNTTRQGNLPNTEMTNNSGLISPELISPRSPSGFQDERDFYEDGVQERSGRHDGPDIFLNLAGNTLSPITIHDFFFSRHYSRLVYLNLWDTNLGIWGAQAVGGLMADRSCHIEYLNLGRNRLGFEGIIQLSGAYKNHSCVELDLSENQLGPKAVHSLQQIMVRLPKDKTCNIRRLNLSNNEINDVGCISIAKIIMGTLLSHLDLSFNKISDWGASTILAAFESNELRLRDINMEANPLSFAGGVDICKVLALPESRITHLDLRGAKVTDVGVPYLAEALKSHNCAVMSLNLFDCQLTDAGILKIAIKLSVNKSLRVLGLGCNNIGDLGILALSQALTLNCYLEELDLSENDVALSRAGLEALMSAMTTNTSLVDLRLDVDGHPHVLARGLDEFSVIAGMNAEHGDLTELTPELTHPQQQRLEQQIAVQQSQPYVPPVLFPQPVAEILATTHHATILAPPFSAPVPPTPPPPPLPPLHFHQQQHLHPEAPDERDLERERQQLLLALSSLKTYVRHNYRRTEKMRRLCFEVLVATRILMFAKDDPGVCNSTTTEEATIPLLTGLPTPPIAGVPSPATKDLGMLSTTTATTATTTTTTTTTTTEGLRGTMAGMPWEIKEMILRKLDLEGLLSERQFQGIVNYGSTPRWETVRQPWDRWGEVREAILERTRCYYYEP